VLQWSPGDPWNLMVGSDDDLSPELQVHYTLYIPSRGTRALLPRHRCSGCAAATQQYLFQWCFDGPGVVMSSALQLCFLA
jgi:hypothetical protein